MQDYYKFADYSFNRGTNRFTDITVPVKGQCYSLEKFEQVGSIAPSNAAKKKLYIMPEYFAGSDYSGGLETRANHKTFLKLYGKEEGVVDVFGGCGTYGIAIRLDVSEKHDLISETLASLEGYGIIDEGDYWELKSEWQKEAVQDRAKYLRLELDEYLPDFTPADGEVESLVWLAVNTLELEFSIECTGAYLSEERTLPFVQDFLLIKHIDKDKYALLVNREWSCIQTRELYEQKLKGA